MLSNTAEYALRAMVYLAAFGDRARTADEMAEKTQVPRGYLSKVMRDLRRARLVEAQRGPNGGFVLSRSADAISVLDVVNAVDPIKRITSCPLGLKAHSKQLCPMHRKLDDAFRVVEESFSSTMISELCESNGSKAQCTFPPMTVRGKPLTPRRPPG